MSRIVTNEVHRLDDENHIEVGGRWLPAIPYPLFTAEGLSIWKCLNEANWRPKCMCGRIFQSLEDYNAHIVYKNSPYNPYHAFDESLGVVK